MLEKGNLKKVGMIISIVNLVVLFIFNFVSAKISMFGITEKEGGKLTDLTKNNAIVWIAFLIPILMLAVPFIKEHLKGYEKIVELVLPIAGFLINILLITLVKSKLKSELGDASTIFSVVVKIRGAIGFYLSQLCYVLSFGLVLIASGDVKLGNEKLDSFVKEASSVTSNMTEKVINKVNETITDMKENKIVEEVKDEVVEETTEDNNEEA